MLNHKDHALLHVLLTEMKFHFSFLNLNAQIFKLYHNIN